MAERGVLVLGAGGFIGGALVARLAARGESTIAAPRRAGTAGPGIPERATGELSPASDWPALLADVRAVVHLASRAHAPPGGEAWIEGEAATVTALAAAARRAGVERIVLLSSVKVHGNASGSGRFRASDRPAPGDLYGRAKLRLEKALADSGAPHAVLRPPLVYGPGVKGNFRALVQLVMRGIPLPLASIANRRSLIFLDNLLDLIEMALADPKALGQIWLMRDDREVSTPQLIRMMAEALGRPARLFPFPEDALRAALGLAGRRPDAERLLGSLVVDDDATRTVLGWQPRVALEDGVAITCRSFRSDAEASQRGPGKNESMRPSRR